MSTPTSTATTTTRPQPCSWDGNQWTAPDGLVCNHHHCAMRGRCPSHVNPDAGITTCPRCIRRVKRDIETIVERITLLTFDAEVDGVDSEAMNLIARAAAPQQYAEKRRRLHERYEQLGWCEWPRSEGYRPDDPHHPYAVLTSWAQVLEDAGWIKYHALHWTTTRAAAAIITALDDTDLAQGDAFEDLARDIARCRAHLDDVDHDSRTPDLGRPCPTCTSEHGKGPKLRKRFATHPGTRPGQRCGDRLCPICDGRQDSWHCPDNPEHAWTDEDYRARVDADYLEHATALTADQLAQRFGIKASLVRQWASRGYVRKQGHDQHGRQRYSVKDVAARHADSAAS